MRSPECLAKVRPRRLPIRHLDLLACKPLARTDRDPIPSYKCARNGRLRYVESQVPVRERNFPVSAKKFPVTLDREFDLKLLNLLTERSSKSVDRAKFANFPC